MRILQVHKYLYRKAGAEAYVLDLARLLTEKGHQVALWGTSEKVKCQMSDVKCFKDLLVKYLNFDCREGWRQDIKKIGHMVWSRDAAKKFDAMLKEFKPDIIHIHNIYHHISPSILSVARKYKVPVVMTVHDYHLINPNYTLYDRGEICERQGLSAIAHRCIQNSYLASLAGVIEWQIHKWLGVYEKNIARYIAPTGFVKKKLVEGGVEGKKIEVVRLPVNGKWEMENGKCGDYILYAGRLVEEKGIYLLLEIAKQLTDIQFKIAGVAPQSEMSNVKCQMSNVANIDLLGFVEKEKLQELITGARLVVVPSLWYDPSPLAVLEAMAMGKVVVASRIGGIADLIKDGETGFLINPRNNEMATKSTKEWIDKLRKLYYDETLLERVGQAAREHVSREHNPGKHYEKIMEIYRRVIGN